MRLSVTTDYAKGTGDPSPYLKRIGEAGFSHIHWCHQWNTDFLYSKWEIEQIHTWLTEYGLKLLDLHGSVGPEKNWASPREYERLAGVELTQNRIEMTAQLGGKVIIMHIPAEPNNLQLRKSLAELEPFARERSIRIAIENTPGFDAIEQLLPQYDADYLGLCYDAGHGNFCGSGLEHLSKLKDRLISIHLHDNDGSGDQHMLPFSGTVDWQQLTGIIAQSAYTDPVSMEVGIGTSVTSEEDVFLKQAFEAGVRLTRMIAEHL